MLPTSSRFGLNPFCAIHDVAVQSPDRALFPTGILACWSYHLSIIITPSCLSFVKPPGFLGSDLSEWLEQVKVAVVALAEMTLMFRARAFDTPLHGLVVKLYPTQMMTT